MQLFKSKTTSKPEFQNGTEVLSDCIKCQRFKILLLIFLYVNSRIMTIYIFFPLINYNVKAKNTFEWKV